MNKIELTNFIESFGEKTIPKDREQNFTDYVFNKTDFKKILDIIKNKEIDLLVLPKESTGGSVEGYSVLNAQGRLLMRISKDNIHKECGYTPGTYEKVFKSFVQDGDNMALLELLNDEGLINAELPKTFKIEA